ncbi:hypothetical protein MHK_010724, partial [Candidatus Magnetomorum sp. HK-1]
NRSIQNYLIDPPTVRVHGVISKNSQISGLHAQKRLAEDLTNVLIQESEMKISNNPTNMKLYEIDIKHQDKKI